MSLSRLKSYSFCLATFLLGASIALAQVDARIEAADHQTALDPALQKSSHSWFSSTRAETAMLYGRILSDDAAKELLRMSQDSSKQVRANVFFSLGQLAWVPGGPQTARGPESLAAFIKGIADSDHKVASAALEGFGKLASQKAEETILPFLKSPVRSIRVAALHALYNYRYALRLSGSPLATASFSDALINSVLKISQDTDKDVQLALATFLSRNKEPRAISAIQQLLTTQNFKTQFYALSALRASGQLQDAPLAIPYLKSDNQILRLAALQAILKLGSAPPRELSKDSSPHIRAAYAAALTASATAHTDWVRLSHDSSRMVRIEASKRLLEEDAPNEFLFYNTLKASDPYLIEAAVELSSNLKEKQFRFLNEAFKNSSPLVRASVLSALSTPEGAAPLIQEGLRSEDLSVRYSAADAVIQAHLPGPEPLLWGSYTASKDKKWQGFRREIVALLSNLTSEEATAHLQDAAQDPCYEVAHDAYLALVQRKASPLPREPKVELSFSPYKYAQLPEDPVVALETNRGRILIKLFTDRAPIHAANFVGLAESGFFDQKPFHRVVSNFVIQGGSTDKFGYGTDEYSLRAEINQIPFERGTLGMARGQELGSASSQFFINHVPTAHLDGQYTAFGQVIEGLDVVDRIERGDVIIRAYLVD